MAERSAMRPVAGVTSFQADIADLVAIQPAFDGVDTVVHLAANAEAGKLLRRGEGDRRVSRRRPDAARRRRRPLGTAADGGGAPRQAERRRLLVREFDPARAARRRAGRAAGGGDAQAVDIVTGHRGRQSPARGVVCRTQ